MSYINLLKTRSYNEIDFLLLENDDMGKDILSGTVWEEHIINFLNRNITENDVFIDVGSNYGWHSLLASKKCKRVYSFEPQKEICNIQELNIKQNNIKNIELFNIGLGNENTSSFMPCVDYSLTAININFGDQSISTSGNEISIKKLDSIINEKINYIKIDVQGYEKFVLEGARNLINEYHPILIVEFESFQLAKFSYTASDLFNYLKRLNYKGYFLDYRYPSDHVFIHEQDLDKFISINKDFIKSNNSSNTLNYNLENGITEKIIM